MSTPVYRPNSGVLAVVDTECHAAVYAAKKLAIGISSFHSDDASFDLVRQILGSALTFDWLFVVDSAASGGLAERIKDLGDRRVSYYAVRENIGSAGNLARRFEIARSLGAQLLLAFNHDAPFKLEAARALVSAGNTLTGWGALYPLRFEVNYGGYDLSGLNWFPWSRRIRRTRPSVERLPVHWGSSNGALYAMGGAHDPTTRPAAELWMGWEDYLYGLDLDAKASSQWIIVSSLVSDHYETRTRGFLGLECVLADKPDWYVYYNVRNLLLVHLHFRRSVRGLIAVYGWLALYTVRILLSPPRCTRRRAIALVWAGSRDGILGRCGKWVRP